MSLHKVTKQQVLLRGTAAAARRNTSDSSNASRSSSGLSLRLSGHASPSSCSSYSCTASICHHKISVLQTLTVCMRPHARAPRACAYSSPKRYTATETRSPACRRVCWSRLAWCGGMRLAVAAGGGSGGGGGNEVVAGGGGFVPSLRS